MDAEEIGRGLAAHGVPLFAERAPAGSFAPDPAALLRACIESGNPRHRASVIPLLMNLGASDARAALRGASERPLEAQGARWLRWLALAAVYLSHVYRSELTFLLGRPPAVPDDVFDRGGLPAPEAGYGEWGLRALADEIAGVEGAEVDWEESLAWTTRSLIARLWVERSARRAKAGHARSG